MPVLTPVGPLLGSGSWSRLSLMEPPSFWSASAQALTPDVGLDSRKRLKFFLRAWLQRRFTRAWLARLIQYDVSPLWLLRPRLATKLQRAYICSAWGTPERCAALLAHYDIFPRLFPAPVRDAIFRGGVAVLRIPAPASPSPLELRLLYHDRFEKEGDLTLALRDLRSGVVVAALSFCLVHHGDDRMAIIGGLQADNDPRTRQLVTDHTHQLHGLRPKALALWCLRQLAGPWRLARIEAVDDAHHAWRDWRRRKTIAACYDEFWQESGGRPMPGGGWELPIGSPRRPRAEIKPSRRKAHDQRYAMLDALRPALHAAIADLASNPPAPIPEVLQPTNHSY